MCCTPTNGHQLQQMRPWKLRELSFFFFYQAHELYKHLYESHAVQTCFSCPIVLPYELIGETPMWAMCQLCLSSLWVQYVPVQFPSCAREQRWYDFREEGVSWWCQGWKKRGWIGASQHTFQRIPEEASRELTEEGAKYVFVLTAEPGRI